jgi:hypothetical protein
MVHRNRKVVGATAAKVGLSRTEIVVRGAFLSKPEVLGNVITVEGKLFAPLWRSCPVLDKFLTPQSSCLRPLKDVAIFEILREKRKAVHLTLLDRGRVEDEEAEVDPADALGLDAPEAPKHKKRDRCRARASISKALLDSSAKYVPLAVDRGGHEPWCPCVLLGDRSHSIAMEATQTNFHMLWTVVQEDKAAFVPEATALRQPLRAEFSPRGAPGSRLYWIRSKGWVMKTKRAPRANLTASAPAVPKRTFGSSWVQTRLTTFLKAAASPAPPPDADETPRPKKRARRQRKSVGVAAAQDATQSIEQSF